MPGFEKSPPELIERFRVVLDRHPDAERRKMFGYPAAFSGGNMVTGLHGPNWVIRLAEPDLAEIQAIEGGGPFEPMAGHPMRGFALVPPAIVADDAAIDGWLRRAFAHVAQMPAKRPK